MNGTSVVAFRKWSSLREEAWNDLAAAKGLTADAVVVERRMARKDMVIVPCWMSNPQRRIR